MDNAFPASVWAGGRSLSDPQLSPDATRVTFISSGELVVMDADGGPEAWLPLVPKVAHGYEWLPDGTGVVYAGKDNRIHRFDFASSLSAPITTVDHDISAVTVSPDGTRAAYVDDFHDVLVVDLKSGAITRLSSDADFVFDPAWSPDSQYIAWHEWDVPNMAWDGSRIVVRNSDASDAIRTVAGGDNIGVQQPQFSPDGKYLGFLSDESGWLNLWRVDAKTFDDSAPLVAESFEHGAPTWSPQQRSWAWYHGGEGAMVCRNEGGFGRLIGFDIATGAEWPNADNDWHTSLFVVGNKAVAIRAGATRPNEVEIIDGVNVRTLARSSYEGIEKAGVIPKSVEWTSEDGARINGRLYKTQDGPQPLLLWIHGGPTDQSSATLYARFNYFLQRGWSLLVVDYRGTSGWGREYTQALTGEWGNVDVADAVSGAQAAIDEGWAQPDKIVPVGGSAGGFTTLLLLERYPDMWAAGVTPYPVVDLVASATDSWRFEAHYTERLVGRLPQAIDTYKARSPIEHVEDIRAPLLVFHGDGDIVVPIQQSLDLVQRLEKAGRTVEFHAYEGEGHGWRRPETRIDELEQMDRFLNRYVLGMSVLAMGDHS